MKFEDLLQFNHCQRRWKQNSMLIPVTRFDLDEEGIKKFNEILTLIKSMNFSKIVRTPSGAIKKRGSLNNYNCWDYRYSNFCAEITVLNLKGCWRFQCRSKLKSETENKKPIYGATALKMFKEMCLKKGIDLENYAVDNGLEIKKEWKENNPKIYKKYIHPMSENKVRRTLYKVHHIDLCSGFQSGLTRAFPEFYPVCKELYDKRKTDDVRIKSIQVESIGAMWSDSSRAKYIKLAKGAIEENNRLLMEIVGKLIKNGRNILLLNTDGVWYQGEEYHDDTETNYLGGWKTDHRNCQFRMKNNAAYEFIEDGKYTPVMSGATALDQIKDRSEWEWGDIFKAIPITYSIDENGIREIK